MNITCIDYFTRSSVTRKNVFQSVWVAQYRHINSRDQKGMYFNINCNKTW